MFKVSNLVRRQATTIMALGIFWGAAAHAVTLPPANIGVNAFQFGDFTSYSLNGLCEGFNGDVSCGVGNPFRFSASNLKPELTILVDGMGQADNSEVAGADDAYISNDLSGSTTSTVTISDPGGAGEFTGDAANTWDVRLSTVRSLLGMNDLVFLFNQNEELGGAGAGVLGTNDVLLYGRVTLLDDASTDMLEFYLTGDKAAAMLADPTEATANNDSRWALAKGTFCVEAGTGNFRSFGTCPGNPGDVQVTTNSGANIAFNAAYSEALDEAIDDMKWDSISITLVLKEQSDGKEQAWFCTTCRISVPEPSALAIIVVGVVGLGITRRRRAA